MDEGKYRKEKEPTNTTTISIVQLVKKSVCPSFDVRGRRTNKRSLLRLLHPRGRWAGQGPRKSKAGPNAPLRDAARA
jgi:hypothetical protein